MAQLRGRKTVEAFHEPERRAPARRGVARPECADLWIGAPSLRFMVPMRGRIGVRAFHKPLSGAGLEGPGGGACGCFFRWRITILRVRQNAREATGPLTTTDPNSNGRP